MTRNFLLLTLGFAACTPQNAQIESGEWTAWLASNTSQSIYQEAIDFDKAETTFNIDCRDIDDSEKLDSPIDICGRNWANANEGWIANDGYYGVGGTLEPWRGEAIITSEGDVQIGFHQRLPGGEDFRFSITIDPYFQPQRCAQDENGDPIALDIDGDWISEWSNDVDSGMLYYLTSGAFQFNPDETGDIWSLPQEWRSGMAIGRFAAEDLSVRRPYYAEPAAYSSYAETEDGSAVQVSDLFYSQLPEGADPANSQTHQQLIRRVERISEDSNEEFVDLRAPIVTQVHTNEWRISDGSAAGLDSWVELHYSWIRFDEGTTFNKGDELSGEFQLMFDATESQTRVAVTGTFTVDKLKRDRWVTDNVQAAKLEESGIDLCVNDVPGYQGE